MTNVHITLPDSLHRHLREIARSDGVSINAFITTAIAEKVSALATEVLISTRASAERPGAFTAVLDRVPRRRPLAGDEGD